MSDCIYWGHCSRKFWSGSTNLVAAEVTRRIHYLAGNSGLPPHIGGHSFIENALTRITVSKTSP
ncbi:MAG TPA: hypothetical protein VGY56_11100, partial [Verrucomicrobiae bacterium]|nr:hypothetical protein [Verrucomicrobiae bacterium]